MANIYQNPVAYTDECLRVLQNNIVLGDKVSRKHQKEFAKDSMKVGDTMNIRRPAQFLVNSGAAFSASDPAPWNTLTCFKRCPPNRIKPTSP